jgi:prephenate dehydrogenase
MTQTQTVGIIGCGLIGGSFALEIRRHRWAKSIIGFDQNPAHAQKALAMGLVDKIYSPSDLLKSCELILIAVPVSATLDYLQLLLPQLSEGQYVMDVGSTKATLSKAFADNPKRQHLVLSHPMAGTEYSGPEASLLNLFTGKASVICEADKSHIVGRKLVENLYSTLGMRLVFMTAEEHDLATAYVSHLSHITSFMLANTVLNKEKDAEHIFNLASAGFESTVRLAKSSPDMWAPIFEHNHNFISQALDAYIHFLKTFKSHLAAKDYVALKQMMEESNKIKPVLGEIQKQGRPA